MPSEPAEVRAGGPQPGGTPAPFVVPVPPAAEPPIAASGAPVAAAALPRLDAVEAAPLPSFGSAPSSGPVEELVPGPGELPVEPAPVLEPEPPVALAAPLHEPDAPFAEVDGGALEPALAEAATPDDPLPPPTPPAQVTRFAAVSSSDPTGASGGTGAVSSASPGAASITSSPSNPESGGSPGSSRSASSGGLLASVRARRSISGSVAASGDETPANRVT